MSKPGLNSEGASTGTPDDSTHYQVETSIWFLNGRISRFSFWGRLILANVIFSCVFALIRISVTGQGYEFGPPSNAPEAFASLLVALVYIVFPIALIWFALATQVKRWHDLGHSGWMVLLNLTIIALPFTFIYLGFFKGTEGPNRFGDDPKEVVRRELAEEARKREDVISWADATRGNSKSIQRTRRPNRK